MKGRLAPRLGVGGAQPCTYHSFSPCGVLVGYLEEPFLIVGSWTTSSGSEEQGTSPDYPLTWF